jgi:hypothetical protein
MNDPHVEALYYAVKHGEHVDYTKAAPFDHAEMDFSVHITDNRAEIAMKTHFPSLAKPTPGVDTVVVEPAHLRLTTFAPIV